MTTKKLKYKYLNKVTAEAGFEVYGKNVEDLFAHAAEALTGIMVDLKTIKAVKDNKISLSNSNLDGLLFDFLNELVYLKDVEGYLGKRFKVRMIGERKLEVDIMGDYINPEEQSLGLDVKAITKHGFEVVGNKDGYRARVIVDV